MRYQCAIVYMKLEFRREVWAEDMNVGIVNV